MKSNVLLSIVFSFFLYSNLANAENGKIFTKSCDAYSSSSEFVKQSSLFCISQTDSKSCTKEARSYFKNCKFQGDYKKIARDQHRKMLVVFLLANPRDVAKIM